MWSNVATLVGLFASLIIGIIIMIRKFLTSRTYMYSNPKNDLKTIIEKLKKQKSDLFQKIQNTNELIDLLNSKIRSAQQLVVSQNFNGPQMLLLKYRQVTRHLNEILLLSLIHKETKKENENWNDKDFSRELQHFGEYFVKIKKSLQEAVQENTSKDELYFVQKSGINYIEDFREEFKI